MGGLQHASKVLPSRIGWKISSRWCKSWIQAQILVNFLRQRGRWHPNQAPRTKKTSSFFVEIAVVMMQQR
jgi:hypothetical protein